MNVNQSKPSTQPLTLRALNLQKILKKIVHQWLQKARELANIRVNNLFMNEATYFDLKRRDVTSQTGNLIRLWSRPKLRDGKRKGNRKKKDWSQRSRFAGRNPFELPHVKMKRTTEHYILSQENLFKKLRFKVSNHFSYDWRKMKSISALQERGFLENEWR